MGLIGLTGGIASGKSIISNNFKELGAYIIDADEISHNVISTGTSAWKDIIAIFGRDIINNDETINRDKLGKIIFSSKEKREELNHIIHPLVFMEEEKMRKEIIKKDPDAVILFDAPLLIETGAHELMDKIILVYCSKLTQIKRLMQRNGLDKHEAVRRIETQLPFKKKKEYAHYIIDSNKPIYELQKEVSKIYIEIKKEFKSSHS